MSPENLNNEETKTEEPTEGSGEPLLQELPQIPEKRGPGRPKGPSFQPSNKRTKKLGKGPHSSNGSEAGDPKDHLGRRSSPGSSKPHVVGTEKASLSKKDKEALTGVVSGIVIMATQFSSGVIVKDPFERANGLFVATEDQAKEIAAPAVSMLARRGTGSGVGDSDFADIFALFMAVVGFIGSNIAKRIAIKEAMATGNLGERDSSGLDESVRTTPSAGSLLETDPGI